MLTLRNLHHMTALARCLNYSRAADEIGITQPSLTRSIQALEQQLGTVLFDRDRGGSVRLTPQGEIVAQRAKFLLTDADDLERHIRLYHDGEHGRLRFGMTPMPARTFLHPILTSQISRAPNVTNEVVVRDVEPLWDMMNSGDIEFFVSADRPLHDLSGVRSELLGTFPLSIIVRPDHPLLTGSDDGQKFPLLRSSFAGMAVPDIMQPHIIESPNVVEDFAVLAAVTASTDAIWLSSAYAVREKLAEGSLVEFLKADTQVEVTLYSLKRRKPSPLMEKFLVLLKTQIGGASETL